MDAPHSQASPANFERLLELFVGERLALMSTIFAALFGDVCVSCVWIVSGSASSSDSSSTICASGSVWLSASEAVTGQCQQ